MKYFNQEILIKCWWKRSQKTMHGRGWESTSHIEWHLIDLIDLSVLKHQNTRFTFQSASRIWCQKWSGKELCNTAIMHGIAKYFPSQENILNLCYCNQFYCLSQMGSILCFYYYCGIILGQGYRPCVLLHFSSALVLCKLHSCKKIA